MCVLLVKIKVCLFDVCSSLHLYFLLPLETLFNSHCWSALEIFRLNCPLKALAYFFHHVFCLLSGHHCQRLHGQISLQCPVWLDSPAHQSRAAQQERHGGVDPRKRCRPIAMHDNIYEKQVSSHTWSCFSSVCPSESWTFLALRTLRRTASSSSASTMQMSSCSITSTTTSSIWNRWAPRTFPPWFQSSDWILAPWSVGVSLQWTASLFLLNALVSMAELHAGF